jgi:hypothetical protein
MDEVVRQAMAKWPKVPHCYGWLALDARGAFRMRDEAAQAAQLPGDVIRHPSLLAFIYRNYLHDDSGAWFFQNGPQRVFVELEETPFIARTDPTQGFVTHDGEPVANIDAAWITAAGRLILKSGEKIAMVDDRDLAESLTLLRMDGKAMDDAMLLDWLESMQGELQLQFGQRYMPVQPLKGGEIGKQLGFVAHPALRNPP